MEEKRATKPMRQKMPSVARFLDDLRNAFGYGLIDEQIRKGHREGKPTFHATENGHELGTPFPRGVTVYRDRVTGMTVAEDER